MTPEEIIKRLPGEMMSTLEGHRYFSDLTLVAAQEGNVSAKIEALQATLKSKNQKAGAGVIALETVADDLNTNLAFGPMLLYPAFQVWEQVEINRGAGGTGKWGISIARQIVKLIKPSGFAGLVKAMEAAKPCITPLGPLKGGFAQNLIGHLVEFQCIEWTDEVMAQVQMPQFEGTANIVTITSATADAEIWFNMDDSPVVPTWGKPESTSRLYAGPVEMPIGNTYLRARAFKEGMVPSWVARDLVTVS